MIGYRNRYFLGILKWLPISLGFRVFINISELGSIGNPVTPVWIAFYKEDGGPWKWSDMSNREADLEKELWTSNLIQNKLTDLIIRYMLCAYILFLWGSFFIPYLKLYVLWAVVYVPCLLSFFKYLWSDYFLLDRNGDTDNTAVNRRQMGSPHHRTHVLWGNK